MPRNFHKAFKTIDIFLLSVILFASCSPNDSSSEEIIFQCTSYSLDESKESSSYESGYYYEPNYAVFIDTLSEVTFDYENPNYGCVKLPSRSKEYELSGEDTYKLTSQFNDFIFDSIVGYESASEELLSKINNSIDLLVSYRTVLSEANSDDATPHFYIYQDGTVFLLDHSKWLYVWTDSNQIDYERFGNDVMWLIGECSL